jgi:hypothetical protein
MSNLDKKQLKEFIFKASRATYASGDESIKQKQKDNSTTIVFEEGDYKYNDNYFGGEPYGGREVVFLKNKPIWMMVYFGLVHKNIEAKEVYPFLVESLSNTTTDMPYRGPTLFEKGNFKYTNDFDGNVNNFSGVEKIFNDSVCIYEAKYMGGLVDQ